MKTSRLYRKAGDVLRDRGWCQGGFRRGRKNLCVLGAMNVARRRKFNTIGGWDEFIYPLHAVIGWESPDWWNDRAGRTHTEVLQALDAAYILALQEEGEDDLTDYEEL